MGAQEKTTCKSSRRAIPVTKYRAATSSWGRPWVEAAWGKKCTIFHVPFSIYYQRQHFKMDGLTLTVLQVWLFLPCHSSFRLSCWVFDRQFLKADKQGEVWPGNLLIQTSSYKIRLKPKLSLYLGTERCWVSSAICHFPSLQDYLWHQSFITCCPKLDP